jgi:hypothetical protein
MVEFENSLKQKKQGTAIFSDRREKHQLISASHLNPYNILDPCRHPKQPRKLEPDEWTREMAGRSLLAQSLRLEDYYDDVGRTPGCLDYNGLIEYLNQDSVR